MSDIDAIGQQMATFFAERGADPYYHVQKQWVDSIAEIVDRFSALSHFFWLLDLLVVLVLAGTIALLAVEERYHEIAIRRVEGASVSQVVWPLVGEGALLALASVPLGYLLARWILSQFVTPILAWPPILPGLALMGLPPLFLLVGIASNLRPARRVARLSPTVVLREYEGEG